MINFVKPAAGAIALAMLTAGPLAAPAAAQAQAPVRGIGVVNLAAVVQNSNAYRVAQQQRPVTYKETIDQATARRTAIGQQLQPLYTKLQTDSQVPNANQQALQQQAAQIQQIEQAAERELQQILAPVALSQAYVQEQVEGKLSEAVQEAAKKQSISLILTPDNVVFAEPAYNMTQAVLDEVNRLVPSAQLVPPQGWLPRELREQQAQQQAAQAAAQGQPAAPTAAPAQGPAVEGR
ncbi:MAG: hypothetical protein B7Z08_06030 [Sphingomonadales bacterium 32-68-7]|nr:MAG: hypothetical protein B7Z33_04610 [Sphingomonadales bacterium 12-68-11]OYX09238.1 MAG: hypothetical protein B7Z08_06030 [Sphingomonadales bacterium 32-68-7]